MPAQIGNPPDSLENSLTSNFDSWDRWLQNARQHTDEFNRKGPRAPTTWVLVSGHEIPDNAIEAGKEGDNTLYVARAYVEVKSSFTISSMTSHNPHLDFQI